MSNIYKSGNINKILELSGKLITESNEYNEQVRAEMTYVQMGIIAPLANEFIEASGLKD